MDYLDSHSAEALSRRGFLRRAAGAGLGVAAVAYLGSGTVVHAQVNGTAGNIPNPGKLPGIPGANQDQAVLNYALSLETLEADLYRQALNRVAGRNANAELDGNLSGYKMQIDPGNLPDAAAAAGFAYLVQFTAVEAAHRDYIRSIIEGQGGSPVRPNVGGYHFPDGVGDTLQQVLQNLLPVEELGVRAYLGATGLVKDFNILTTAATIYSTECSHCSAIRSALGKFTGPVKEKGDQRAFPLMFSEAELEYYRDPKQVLKDVAPYLIV